MPQAFTRGLALATALSGVLACGSPASPSGPNGLVPGSRSRETIPGAGVSIGAVLYRPALAPTDLRPGIVVVHGHLPYDVDGALTVQDVAERYADLGYIAVAMSMRGWPQSGGADDCGLEQPDDIVRVVEWLRAEPGVDPAHVGLIGYSKGGQMVLLAASRNAAVAAVVAYYPVVDLARWRATTDRDDTGRYIDTLCDVGPGLAPRSPVHHADTMTAPILLVHGDADANVPLDQSQAMFDALGRAGRLAQFLIVPGAGHDRSSIEMLAVQPAVDAFLAARLAR